MHLTALLLTHQAALLTMAGSKAVISLLMLASSMIKVLGRGVYTLDFR